MLDEKPELIELPSENSSEGSFTLQYKKRFLYSKYNPQKNILAAVAALEILPDSLVLVFSPGLFYGWKELKQKCDAASSEILCVEAEAPLHEFAQKAMQAQNLAATLLPLGQNTARGLDCFISSSQKKFRRVLRLDFSAGVSFNAEFYKNFFECAQNIVAAFWKNRLTLVRLGRLYCKNIFKNLLPAARAIPFEALERTVEKPILVCGAGESLDELTALARQEASQDQKAAAAQTETDCAPKTPAAIAAINQNFFVLAVDAALPSLSAAGIKIDAAAATECQLAVEKAYIGLDDALSKSKSEPIFFFDLNSRPNVARRFLEKEKAIQDQNRGAAACFYFSEFEKNAFIGRLREKGLLPAQIPPLGSVGLVATHLALRLRKSADIPVYVLGLDFSFSAGRTHARGTAQSKALFFAANRLRPAQNCAAAFAPGAEKTIEKDGRATWTSKNLLGYAALFRDYFNGAKNLFDAGKSGVDLGLERKSLADIVSCSRLTRTSFEQKTDASQNAAPLLGLSNNFSRAASNAFGLSNDYGKDQNARGFMADELSALRALADLLSNGDGSKFRDKSLSLDAQILRELRGREYLYLHFPDGTQAKTDRAFLTRVKAQIDFFAKDIETALAADSLIAARQF